jgi:hypothetical protein
LGFGELYFGEKKQIIMINFPDCKCSSIPEACACENDCEYQDYLVENGFVMSCDRCGHAGHVDSDGWIGEKDNEGGCSVYCSEICAGKENMRIHDAAQKVID